MARQGELDHIGTILKPPLRGRKPRRDRMSGLVRGAVEDAREQIVDVVMEVELPGW